MIVHAAAIALVLLARSTALASAKTGVVAFNLAATANPAPRPIHPHRLRPAKVAPKAPATLLAAKPVDVAVIDVALSLPDALPLVDDVGQEMSMAAGGCDLTQPVQDALRHNEQVERQLPTIPATDRSVANAIVLWNAGWVSTSSVPAGAALTTIRQTIVQTIAASSTECRSQLQAGPRLIYLPVDAGKTLVLALGSGRWTWQQLVDGTTLLPRDTAPAVTAPLFVKPAVAQLANTPSGQPSDPVALLASLMRTRSSTGLPVPRNQ